MNAAQSTLTITYTGNPVEVNSNRITEEIFVPNLGFDGDLRADDQPGASAASLFREAESEGALLIPDALAVDCYARDDFRLSGFMLVARPAAGPCVNVTRGWCDVETVARARGDTRTDNDPAVVREALEFMVHEINETLGAK